MQPMERKREREKKEKRTKETDVRTGKFEIIRIASEMLAGGNNSAVHVNEISLNLVSVLNRIF